MLRALPVCFLQQVTLNNGVVMPRVGFGTAGLGQETESATTWALAAGYRLLDSAQVRAARGCLGAPHTGN
jgi:diketogulonate reductase-like aldo/keto reductase